MSNVIQASTPKGTVLAVAICFMLAVVARTSTSCAQTTIGGDGKEWTVIGDAASDTDISGAACSPDGTCLVVSDEKRRAWFFSRDESDSRKPRILTGERIRLKPAAGGDEADVEAAAFDNGHFYAIGSHGTARKKGEFQVSRYSVYRIREDGSVEPSDRLAEILSDVPGISEHFCTGKRPETCEALRDGGANIEGMAVRDGLIYVGFRAPAPNGMAFVVRVAEDAVFGTAEPNLAVFRLPLGHDANDRDLGIRDLAAVSDGFLVLAGPSLPEGDDAEGSGAAFHWREDADLRKLRDVGLVRHGVKPEALLVLGEDSGGYRVLVMHDGIPGGAPVECTVARRALSR